MAMKKLRWLIPLLLGLLYPAAAHAQYLPIQGWCMDGAQRATLSGLDSTNEVQASYPSCTVTVTEHGGGGVTIYSTSAGGALANPFTANTNGQWLFYVDPTLSYDVTLSGGTPDAFPAPVVYYSDISPSGGGSGGGSVKPSSAAGIVFVSLQGNDTNDCLSWGSSCLTVQGGYNKLPGDGGTIYVTSGSQSSGPACTSVAGQGLGIAGSSDPNYASMPMTIGAVRWVKAKSNFAGVAIVGVSANASGQNATTGALTPIQCGGDTAPAFQFSYTQGITLLNLSMAYPKQGILVNIDSNGLETGAGGSGSNMNFENLAINICNSCGATPGPNIWIGGNFLWLRLANLALQGNPGNATPEGRAAILIDTNGGTASGLVHMYDINSTGGGNFVLVNDATIGTQSFDIHGWTMEGSGIPTPISQVIGTTGVFGGEVFDLVMSDAASAPWVKTPQGTLPFQMKVHTPMGQDSVMADGPMDIIGVMRIGGMGATAKVGQAASPNVAPQAAGWLGYPLQRLTVQTDVQRRSFTSVFTKYTNLASQLTSAWTAMSGDVTITTGRTAPDATTGAAKVATISTGGAIAYSASPTYAIGDYLYVGVWAREASTSGTNNATIVDSAMCLCFPFVSGPTIRLINGSYLANAGSVLAGSMAAQTDGEWQYLWALGKVVDGAGAVGTRLQLQAQSTAPMEFYAPVFAKFSAASVALVSAPVFSSGSESGNIVTIGTTGVHALTAGEPILISACTPSGYNGEFVIASTPLTTSFTYYDSNSGLGAASGCVITPGNDSEAADWALNTGTWADNAPANTLAGPRGIKTSFGASGNNFWGTLTHANTANRVYTFPNADGTVCASASDCTASHFFSDNGAVGTPAYSFASSPTTGWWFSGTQVCLGLVGVSQLCTNGGPGITSSGSLCSTTATRCLSSTTLPTSLDHGMAFGGGMVTIQLPRVAGNPATAGWGTPEKGDTYFNTTSNIPRYWDGSVLRDYGPKSSDCGSTTTCGNTNVTGMRLIVGTAPLDNASPSKFTITGISPAFTSTSTYTCWTYNTAQHLNDVPQFNPVSTSSFTFTTQQNTLTDTMSYGCIGY